MPPRSTTIQNIVNSSVHGFAHKFLFRHLAEAKRGKGPIHAKANNFFLRPLGQSHIVHSALSRSLDSAMGDMIEHMALQLATLSFDVEQVLTGELYPAQRERIGRNIDDYKHHRATVKKSDVDILETLKTGTPEQIVHASDYHLVHKTKGNHALLELKIGGDLDTKKALAEKYALLEQYCLLKNALPAGTSIDIYLATAYNKNGDDASWTQSRVRQYFAEEELLIGREFWNFVTDLKYGYELVKEAYDDCAHVITDAVEQIEQCHITSSPTASTQLLSILPPDLAQEIAAELSSGRTMEDILRLGLHPEEPATKKPPAKKSR